MQMDIKYTYKSDEKPISVLMLNNKILDVCDLSHENSSIKAEIKFVIPPRKGGKRRNDIVYIFNR